ncbi:MAG TPA: hypothetical protein QF882_12800, partial [Arenicellales bacterium]|nr:hypothetical protein [Arenicellales bacterium]
AAAQMAPLFCHPAQDARVLDACAAPGGKCTQLLETSPQIQLTALDLPERTKTIGENLARLGLVAQIIAADVLQVDEWWDGKLYDLIVLDAPCSGTGVIRRHPDIRHHRRASDLDRYAQTQIQMAKRLWPLLAPGGQFLYITCSILAQENDTVLEAFCRETPGACPERTTRDGALATTMGNQFLPSDEHDGLYYASLIKV